MNKSFIYSIKLVTFFLFVMTPLLSAVLFCLKDGKMISDIYIPLGGWSDEITYYKQIEGILSHGMPRGYFGYNQSRAMYGTLGVWGLIPLIPYVIWGFFFGWNYCSPIYSNIFFCMLALLGVYLLLRPPKKCMCMFSFFWFSNQFLNRYLVSGVIEASVTAQLLIVTALGIYLLSDTLQNEKKRADLLSDNAAIMLCTFLICFMTLGRPYYAVLFLIPFWKACKDKRKIWLISLPFLTIVIMVVFFLNNHFFCSSYFNNILSFQGIREQGLSGLFKSFFTGLIEIARLMWYAVRYKGVGVGWYYLLLAIELFVMIVACVQRKLCHKTVSPMFLIALVGDFLILLSIIEMYDLGVGARHILALIVANALLLVMESHLSVNGILAAICLISVIQTGNADTPPYRNDDYVKYMNQLTEEFVNIVQVSNYISYDNVVAMPTADSNAQNSELSVSTYYGLLFAMPAGVGISLDYEDFYNTPENIKAGYILVHPNGSIREKLEAIGMHCIYENEELALYSK